MISIVFYSRGMDLYTLGVVLLSVSFVCLGVGIIIVIALCWGACGAKSRAAATYRGVGGVVVTVRVDFTFISWILLYVMMRPLCESVSASI